MPLGQPPSHRARDRLARAIIDDAHRAVVGEAMQQVQQAERELAAARTELARAQRLRSRWQRAGDVRTLIRLRAIRAAQIADLAETDVPPGAHLRAVVEFLREHYPPDLPDPGPAGTHPSDAS